MFQFDLAAIEDRDVNDCIEALALFLDAVAGQRDNPCFVYLLEIFRAEAKRRQDHEPGGAVEVILPLGDSTYAHIWALLKFTGAVVEMAAKGKPSAAGQFFGRIIDQIEAATQRAASAAMN
jgi:hypothetical protein